MTSIGTSTGAFFDRGASGLAALRARAEKLQDQIGRGEKLSRSSDNPVAASRLRALSRADTLSGIDMANVNRATSDLTLADSAMSAITNTIIRAQELTTQAANSTLTASQRASIGTELTQIHGTLLTIANSRDSAGHALFGGEGASNAYALDAAGNATYIGTASAGDLPLGDGQSIARGMTGPQFLNFSVNGNPTDLMSAIKALGEALGGAAADPAGAAREALTALGEGLETVTTAQTIIGSRLAWLDLSTERHIDKSELRASEQADIGGTDISSTVAELQQILLVLNASQASFAKLAELSLFDQLR